MTRRIPIELTERFAARPNPLFDLVTVVYRVGNATPEQDARVAQAVAVPTWVPPWGRLSDYDRMVEQRLFDSIVIADRHGIVAEFPRLQPKLRLLTQAIRGALELTHAQPRTTSTLSPSSGGQQRARA